MTTLEIRSMTVRSVDTAERTVTGIAVPYGQKTNVGDYDEMFERGAFGDATDVKLFYGHSEPIGLVTEGRDTEDGYEVTARISQTPRGDEVYTLLRDGVLNKFSVGFIPVENRIDDNGVVVRTKADLKEVSVVAFPAYAGASVSEVRNEKDSDGTATENTNNEKGDIFMSENTIEVADVADLRATVADMERRMAVLADADHAVSAPQFRSGGEFLKALAAGSQEARDFAKLSDGNPQPAWVTDDLRMKAQDRKIVNLFAKAPLPKADVIKYKKISGLSGTVGVQVNEGDALPYMEVSLTDALANVETYGGYTSLSRQAIELNSTPVLDVTLRYMTAQYAKATNDAVRAALVAGTGYGTAAVTADTAAEWIDVVVDSVDYIDANGKGSSAEFLLVSSDVYKRLAHMVDGSDRPLFGIAGQSVNSLGTANVTAGTLNVAGLTVIKDTGLAANSAYVAASDAVTVWESAGAPFRLEDDDVIHLTRDFSIYGYMAIGVTNANAVVKVDVDLA